MICGPEFDLDGERLRVRRLDNTRDAQTGTLLTYRWSLFAQRERRWERVVTLILPVDAPAARVSSALGVPLSAVPWRASL